MINVEVGFNPGILREDTVVLLQKFFYRRGLSTKIPEIVAKGAGTGREDSAPNERGVAPSGGVRWVGQGRL